MLGHTKKQHYPPFLQVHILPMKNHHLPLHVSLAYTKQKISFQTVFFSVAIKRTEQIFQIQN